MPTKRKRGTTRKVGKSKTSKRTVIEPHKGDRRYVRRNKAGEFKKEVSVGRSLAADRRRKAKSKVAKGQGDRGDTTRGASSIIERRERAVKRVVRKLKGS